MDRMLQRAFTLIEVNLAIFIMAGGVLAMISLYSLGFRESRQSREDVAAAALADEVLNPLVIALSSRKWKWSEWRSLDFDSVDSGSGTRTSGTKVQVLPGGGKDKSGWLAYVDTRGSRRDKTYYVLPGPKDKANGVYGKLMDRYRSLSDSDPWQSNLPRTPTIPDNMTYALVASRESETSPVITLAVRFVRNNLRNTLMAQPIFSTEVHFQGDPNN